ncbi:hypothetical protein SK128_003284, partial [Halocaridina rubra]
MTIVEAFTGQTLMVDKRPLNRDDIIPKTFSTIRRARDSLTPPHLALSHRRYILISQREKKKLDMESKRYEALSLACAHLQQSIDSIDTLAWSWAQEFPI